MHFLSKWLVTKSERASTSPYLQFSAPYIVLQRLCHSATPYEGSHLKCKLILQFMCPQNVEKKE